MKVFKVDESFQSKAKSILTIGNFDGIHRGHRHIINKCFEAAEELDAEKITAVTFEPHPVYLLKPDKAPKIITPLEMKANLLEKAGVDELAVITDSTRLLNMAPEEFAKDFLTGRFNPAAIVEGCDFRFGYSRSGDIDTLKELGKVHGFRACCEELAELEFSVGRRRVSSSLIRGFIEQGLAEDAMKALWRPYRLIGEVVPGRGIGRQIGFPTANINPTMQIRPSDGVYTGFVQIGESREEVCRIDRQKLQPSVYSIGRARTFEQGNPILTEAHLLQSSRELEEGLEGRWMAMDFIAKLREQRVFPNKDKLAEQIDADCRRAEKILSEDKKSLYND
ncbi:Riboflavin biosynthesis protein RibF [Sedimentisphaera cyanobacteriorum]|uniref:Riboflavin biosynthesis protein n=1 Tax=Sedimentisphaera cyanobacteriorum TaxID=1940790 RepID=A0A1Q2HQN3_9BACT|nr:riboflavin biosynthesis protein RibF [Sedimentisphaera cyanobacteriorum]AQQ09555.1 Riboflavin biosynthesis protein RibF [Sedimentisphaera cyanobacteriorum]